MKTPVQLVTAIAQPATGSLLGRAVMLLLLSFWAGLVSVQPCAATSFQWEYTGNLRSARDAHTATLLANGKVLVAGGDTRGFFRSAELYDPTTGHWNRTGKLFNSRADHTATLLSNGAVLVA